MNDWDVVIVGGGPAGLSAALMLGRSRRRVLVVDSGLPRNRFAAHMHGVLGYEGESPSTLLTKGRQEVSSYGVEIVEGEVSEVRESTPDSGDAYDKSRATPDHLKVTLLDGTTMTTRLVIVASGLEDQLPDIPGLAERWGTTVLHCPYCHGWEVRNQRLGVLVTSPMGAHLAQLVRQLSPQVTVFTDGNDIFDEQTLALLSARDVVVTKDKIVEVTGEGDQVTGVSLHSGDTLLVDAIFVAATPNPNLKMLKSLSLDLEESPAGTTIAVNQLGQTSHPRIFAVGNVATPFANVPLSIGLGSFAGAGANATLTSEDFALAHRAP